MRLLLIASGALLPLFAMGCNHEEKAPPPAHDSGAAEKQAIELLGKLVTAQNAKSLGFDSVDEVRSAQLAPPLAVRNVGLDQLKAYKPGGDPAALLTETSETVYLVTVNGAVKSSIGVIKKDGGFVPSSFGNADVAKLLGRYRNGQGADEFIVRVPALLLTFVGQRTDKGILLTPIVAEPRAELAAGQALPADVVFARLVPIAQAYNGLPL